MDNLRKFLRLVFLTIVVVGIPMCLYALTVSFTLALGYLHDTDQEAYVAYITELLGAELVSAEEEDPTTSQTKWALVDEANDEEDYVSSAIKPFIIKYWNGQNVKFRVPDKIWKAALKVQQKYDWCDPRFIIALAHSESTTFQNTVCSGAGACGVWQFMPDTWNSLWPGAKKPDRFDISASADAACRYTKNNGMIDALSKDRGKFVFEFAYDPPVWNQHVPQADYVWRAYQEIISQTPLPKVPNQSLDSPYVVGDKIWQKAMAWYLKQLNLMPDTLAYDPNPDESVTKPPDTEIGEMNENTFMMIYKGNYVVTQGLHPVCAVDVARGLGTSVYSPINGKITQKYVDRLGNPTICIENAKYKVTLLHGIWRVKKGQTVFAGEKIGTENTFGHSTGPHTHFDALRRGKVCINPLLLVNTNWQHGRK